MTPKRFQKIKQVAALRQHDLTVVLENVRDQHNIGAVLRSCDSIGIKEIFILYSEPGLREKEAIKIGKRTSAGSRRWVDVHYFTDVAACFEAVKKRYARVLSTHLDESSKSLYELDLTTSTAFLFGNEQTGLSQEALSFSDGNFIVPQVGMVESLNISVACAVTLYETLRQRQSSGLYPTDFDQMPAENQTLFENYLLRKNPHEPEHYVIPKSNR